MAPACRYTPDLLVDLESVNFLSYNSCCDDIDALITLEHLLLLGTYG